MISSVQLCETAVVRRSRSYEIGAISDEITASGPVCAARCRVFAYAECRVVAREKCAVQKTLRENDPYSASGFAGAARQALITLGVAWEALGAGAGQRRLVFGGNKGQS
ncbi:MAG: hypothetical protein FJW40_18035 [Acidobacteria bacterium]|nr:hypothetical protein [Acidobacteriota bacterium]